MTDTQKTQPIRKKIFSSLVRIRFPLSVFLLSLCVFAAVSADRMAKQSGGPHFVYQADAFLHGQLSNRLPAPNANDWIRHNGKTYVCFPPAPAILMMPFVALFGIHFNDVMFTLPFAALNVLLMYLVLQMLSREKLSPFSRNDNLWLCGLFGFGTVHFACSVIGEVWFTAQIIGVTFSLLYILTGFRARRPLLAGLFLAFAFDSRVNLAFTVGYFLLQLLFPRQEDGTFAGGKPSRLLKKLLLFFVPILAVGAAQMTMNYARFHNVFEFGHTLLTGPAGERIKQHGMFSFHYLGWNLRALFLRIPNQYYELKFPFYSYHPDGLSIFITTPLFGWLFAPKKRVWLYPILWIAAIPALLPPLFYQNSGYVQFGYRFSLDITPYLIMLLSVGRTPMNRTTKTLIVVGMLINLAGAIAFKRFGPT